MLIRDVANLLVELGLADPATVRRVLSPKDLDGSLDRYGKPHSVAVVHLLVELSVGVAIYTDGVDNVTEAYPETLQEIAACTDGLVTITDVTVTPPDAVSERSVRFRVNGTPVEWRVADFGREYLDTLVFLEHIGDFADEADPRRWAGIEIDGKALSDYYLFGHPSALRRLAEAFNFTVDVCDLPGD